MNRKAKITTALAVPALAAGTWMAAGDTEAEAGREDAPRLAALSTPQEAQDTLPDVVTARGYIDAGTSRSIASGSDTDFWVASSTDDMVCLVAETTDPAGDWVVGTSCDSATNFNQAGVRLELEVLGKGFDAQLVPDTLDVGVLTRSVKTASSLGDNLVVFDLGERPATEVLIEGDVEFTLPAAVSDR